MDNFQNKFNLLEEKIKNIEIFKKDEIINIIDSIFNKYHNILINKYNELEIKLNILKDKSIENYIINKDLDKLIQKNNLRINLNDKNITETLNTLEEINNNDFNNNNNILENIKCSNNFLKNNIENNNKKFIDFKNIILQEFSEKCDKDIINLKILDIYDKINNINNNLKK